MLQNQKNDIEDNNAQEIQVIENDTTQAKRDEKKTKKSETHHRCRTTNR